MLFMHIMIIVTFFVILSLVVRGLFLEDFMIELIMLFVVVLIYLHAIFWARTHTFHPLIFGIFGCAPSDLWRPWNTLTQEEKHAVKIFIFLAFCWGVVMGSITLFTGWGEYSIQMIIIGGIA